MSVATASALKVRWPDVCHDAGLSNRSASWISCVFVAMCMYAGKMDGWMDGWNGLGMMQYTLFR